MTAIVFLLEANGLRGYVASVKCRRGAAKDDDIAAVCVDDVEPRYRDARHYESNVSDMFTAIVSGEELVAPSIINDLEDLVIDRNVVVAKIGRAICVGLVSGDFVADARCFEVDNVVIFRLGDRIVAVVRRDLLNRNFAVVGSRLRSILSLVKIGDRVMFIDGSLMCRVVEARLVAYLGSYAVFIDSDGRGADLELSVANDARSCIERLTNDDVVRKVLKLRRIARSVSLDDQRVLDIVTTLISILKKLRDREHCCGLRDFLAIKGEAMSIYLGGYATSLDLKSRIQMKICIPHTSRSKASVYFMAWIRRSDLSKIERYDYKIHCERLNLIKVSGFAYDIDVKNLVKEVRKILELSRVRDNPCIRCLARDRCPYRT